MSAPGKPTGEVPLLTLIFYSLPAFALAMPTVPALVFLPTFYARDVGLGLTATGLALFAIRLLDVASDPIAGLLSDGSRSRWGRRKPWIVLGGIGAAIGLIALFRPPENAGITYLIGWGALLYLGWTFVAVPYTAWGAELSTGYQERARITGAREAVMVFGIICAAALPPVGALYGFSDAETLGAIAWMAVGLGALFILLLVAFVPERTMTARQPRHRVPIRDLIGAVSSNKPFLRLLVAWFINGLANGIPSVLFLLFMEHVLGADTTTRGLFILGYFLSAIVAMPGWLSLIRRYGKHRVWCAAMIAACLSFIWVPFLGTGDMIAFGVICLVTGAALGADLALPPAMQADVVDLDSLRTGEQRAGLYFSLWNMATKLALAASAGIALPVLGLFGFSAVGTNSPTALTAIALIYSVLPVVLKIMSIAIVWNHPLTARRHAIIRRRLDSQAQRLQGG
ncbi:MAG: MFS transporter [Proteobacteria bacterium]|nr:MFS transporter [Pseudomonadota bacterium]